MNNTQSQVGTGRVAKRKHLPQQKRVKCISQRCLSDAPQRQECARLIVPNYRGCSTTALYRRKGKGNLPGQANDRFDATDVHPSIRFGCQLGLPNRNGGEPHFPPCESVDSFRKFEQVRLTPAPSPGQPQPLPHHNRSHSGALHCYAHSLPSIKSAPRHTLQTHSKCQAQLVWTHYIVGHPFLLGVGQRGWLTIRFRTIGWIAINVRLNVSIKRCAAARESL